MSSDHQIRVELVALLRDGFRRPAHLSTDAVGLAHLAELARAFCDMNPTAFEWEHVKADFLRSWSKPTWPLPSEFPKRLGAFRQRQAEVSRAADYINRQAEAGTRATPYHHGEYLAACDRASFMATSPDKGEARWGRLLCDLAKILNETRDDHDQPRSARRRAMEAAA